MKDTQYFTPALCRTILKGVKEQLIEDGDFFADLADELLELDTYEEELQKVDDQNFCTACGFKNKDSNTTCFRCDLNFSQYRDRRCNLACTQLDNNEERCGQPCCLTVGHWDI